MAKLSRPRHGSLQFYPRKRASGFLPSVNWSSINVSEKDTGILGFITYKVGMASVALKDNTPDSMTKGKRIIIPATILEVPNMKVYSVRFYKSGKAVKDLVVSNEIILKRKLKVSKSLKNLDSDAPKEYDDIRIIVYSLPSQTSIKKTPDLIELAVNSPNKLEFVKGLIGKEISIKDFPKFELVDLRGLTIGKGLVGPVKRFGLQLKQHKSEKGVRRPGSLGPWHPARVTFRTPISGQMGMFTRLHYNNKILSISSISEKDINPGTGFKHYGKIRGNYILIAGSVQGPVKRQVLITPSFRTTKFQAKKKYEFQEILR